MRPIRSLPVFALLLVLPAHADEGAAKAAPPGDGKPAVHSCCAGEEGADKALCPKGSAKAKTTKKKTTAKAKAAAAPVTLATVQAPAAPGTANMVVTRDPETGEIRNATAAERAKLFAGRAPQAAPVARQVVVLPDGSAMVELGEDSMSYAVVTKNPDGTVTQTCVHGPAAATEARTAPKPAPRAEER